MAVPEPEDMRKLWRAYDLIHRSRSELAEMGPEKLNRPVMDWLGEAARNLAEAIDVLESPSRREPMD